MSFWDTVKGNNLADVLLSTLPQLTAETQYVVTLKDVAVEKFLREKVSAGEKYVNHFSYEGRTTIIMSVR
ncbi:MAG: hypothetical protein PHW34_13535 [Hespellia sp.]|nr:hypothetical protein [Hespellia sp.]